MSEDIIRYEHKEWNDPIQRFKQISDFALDIISPLLNPKVYIEGYSFGSWPRIISDAENCVY